MAKRKGQRRITLWLPEDHPVFLIPRGRRTKWIQDRLEAGKEEEIRKVVVEAVREALREGGEKEKKEVIDAKDFKEELLKIF